MLSPVWSFALARLLLALAVAVALGLLFGHVALWLVAVLGAALGWVSWGALAVGAFAAFVLGGLFAVVLMARGRAGRRSSRRC